MSVLGKVNQLNTMTELRFKIYFTELTDYQTLLDYLPFYFPLLYFGLIVNVVFCLKHN